MRTIPSLVLLVALATPLAAQEATRAAAQDAPAAAQQPKTLALGMRVNGNTVLKDIDGNEHKAKSYQGKITVINFYSIQCPIQAGWDGRLAAIQREFGEQGVVFLNIDSNHTEIGTAPPEPKEGEKPYDNIRSHLKDKDLPYTVLVDHGNVIADAFGAKTTPDVFVFGTDGRLVYRGLIDNDQRGNKGDDAERYLHDVLTKLVAGEKVEPSETKPSGCTIKRVRKPKAAPAAAAKEDKDKDSDGK